MHVAYDWQYHLFYLLTNWAFYYLNILLLNWQGTANHAIKLLSHKAHMYHNYVATDLFFSQAIFSIAWKLPVSLLAAGTRALSQAAGRETRGGGNLHISNPVQE